MSRRAFFQALAVALLLLAGLNSAIGWLGRNAVPRVILRQIKTAPEITHVFLGDSIVEAGFLPDVFTRGAEKSGAAIHPLNAGIGWSNAPEHLILWEQVRARGHRPKTVFFGFFDFHLHEDMHPDVWWKLSGNIAMAYYIDPARAARYHAPGSLAARVLMPAAKFAPIFTERSTFWGKVELARRWLGAQGMRAEVAAPAASHDAPQDAFRAFEATDAATFERRCREIVRDEAPFLPALRDLIASVGESGAQLCFVAMPMPPAHLRTFYAQPGWAAYRAHLQTRLAAGGVALLDASEWVADPASFADSLHLNRAGAELFSERLAERVFAHDSPPLFTP